MSLFKPVPATSHPRGRGPHPTGPKLSLRVAVAVAFAGWAAKRLETRVTPVVMVLVLVMTPLAVLLDTSTILVIGGCITAVVWMTNRQIDGKTSAAEQWANRMSLVPLAATGWFLMVSQRGLGVLTGNVLLGYVIGCTALWMYIFSTEHVGAKVARTQATRRWNASKLGKLMAGTNLVTREKTKLGEKAVIDVTSAGLTQSEVAGNKKVIETIAAAEGLPAGRVMVHADGSHAGRVVVSVRRGSPWEREIKHWNAPNYPIGERTIYEPIPVGEDPESERKLFLQLYVPGIGAQHVKVFGGTRGGKTTFMNSVAEWVTACRGVEGPCELIMIDVSKGKEARVWSPALRAAHFGEESIPAAASTLRQLRREIVRRGKLNGERAVAVHVPTLEEPAILAILDEADALLVAAPEPYRSQAKEDVEFIASKGASEGIILMIAAQRGVLSSLGSTAVKANTFTTVVLPLLKPGEMGYAIDGWESRGMPNMAVYGEGAKGVVLIAPGNEQWTTGRSYALYNLKTVAMIAQSRPYSDDIGAAIAEAQGAALVGDDAPPFDDPLAFEPPADGVDDEDDVATPAGAPDTVPMATMATTNRWDGGHLAPAATVPPRRRRSAEASAVIAEAERVATAALAELANEGEDAARQRWANRLEATSIADQAVTVPDGFFAAVMKVANRRGPHGFTRADAEEASGMAKVATASHLRVMVNQGWLVRTGNGRSVRYYLATLAEAVAPLVKASNHSE